MIPGTSMTYVDVAVILTLLISAIFAYNRGIVKEIMTIASWVVAIFVAVHFYPLLLPFTAQYIPNAAIATGLTMLAIFVVTLILCYLFVNVFCSFEVKSLSALNKTLGFVFGLVRGALILSLLFLALSLVWQTKAFPPVVKNSKTLPLLKAGSEIIVDLVPLPLQEKIPSEVKKSIDLKHVKNVNAIYQRLLVPKIANQNTNNLQKTKKEERDNTSLNTLIETGKEPDTPQKQNTVKKHTISHKTTYKQHLRHKKEKKKHYNQDTKVQFPKGHLLKEKKPTQTSQNPAPIKKITAKDQEQLDLFMDENNH